MSSQTIQVEQIKHFLKELQNRITDKLEALESDARERAIRIVSLGRDADDDARIGIALGT